MQNVTDAAFEHLAGIHTLDMSYCDREAITDAAFVHLKGIHTLNISGCNQKGITDAAFTHLAGIHTLELSLLNWVVTASMLEPLKGINSLTGLFTEFADDDETMELLKAIPFTQRSPPL
jgi:hypothetical protein